MKPSWWLLQPPNTAVLDRTSDRMCWMEIGLEASTEDGFCAHKYLFFSVALL